MTRQLKGIEWSGTIGEPMYFRFLEAPVAQTDSYAGGEVNVDLDSSGNVIGVELLTGDAADFAVFLKIAEERRLDLTGVHLSPHVSLTSADPS